MEFKNIIAKANGNSELEFHAYEREKPNANNYPYSYVDWSIDVMKWEQSAQVFRPFNRLEQDKIMNKASMNIGKSALNENIKYGIDVTDFVVIEEYIGLGLEGYFAFYKSPSKEEPVISPGYEPGVYGYKTAIDSTEAIKPIAEAQEDQDTIIKELIDVFDSASSNSYGYGHIMNSIKSKFKITRI